MPRFEMPEIEIPCDPLYIPPLTGLLVVVAGKLGVGGSIVEAAGNMLTDPAPIRELGDMPAALAFWIGLVVIGIAFQITTGPSRRYG